MFRKLLIANRGEIARRIQRTARRLGVRTVAVTSDADAFTAPVREADEVVRLGPSEAASSYLRADAILEAARATGAEAVHPGYGFLSENTGFAAACEAAGIRFVGPSPQVIADFGLKHRARELAVAAGVPVVPGTGLLADADEALAAAERIGYPVMLKSTSGGGGIGLRVCAGPDELRDAWSSVARLARGAFEGAGAFLERYVARARHVEVQIFGDRGRVLALGERDCSTQRRHQKIIEETPAPNLSDGTRAALAAAAVRLGESVGYTSAGTVEFVVDADNEAAYFLEVNTRLQVEHGVTEAVLGIDLVEWMLRQACGELVLPAVAPKPCGSAIEVRLYAEDPAQAFRPSTGRLTEVRFPEDARVDAWVTGGTEVTPYYDPLLAKVIVHGDDRAGAVAKLSAALAATELAGVATNLPWLRALVADATFVAGKMTTRSLASFAPPSRAVDVVDGGTQTTVQDLPGRLGYWAVGVPPSGPMDDRSARDANAVVGNDATAATLEMVLTGPTLRFRGRTTFALAGARFGATLDGAPVPWRTPVTVDGGAVLRVGAVRGRGARAYLAVAGGFDVPAYLGSRSTFMLGGFGGHAGRALRAGDVLPIAGGAALAAPAAAPTEEAFPDVWEIGALDGPHSAPDFFTEEDIADLFSAVWTVHHNSDRTGVRLVGPKPRWARADGGEAGLHPSNIHDNAYAVGAIDFTGDMPIILGPDGPSLGGFVCPATVVSEERWKLGQLKAGDRVRFRRVAPARPIVRSLDADDARPTVTYRRAGDEYLLVEYGPLRLDLALRVRVQALLEAIEAARWPGVIDLTPGIRSLQVHHDPRVLPLATLVERLATIEATLPSAETFSVPSRIIHLPLSWEDPAALAAVDKYARVVRPDAPWCPSNTEFIRRINGLDSVDDVRRIVFDASYVVLGLGDVYLGAPVATPLDPRHRLVTTKYNPARTWTPENAVGIGGAYLCIYGMEGPGGYQLVGRTVQMWNTWNTTDAFPAGTPWLLRFFDQIRFYPVSADELLDLRARFPHGGWSPRVEQSRFDLVEHQRFVAAHAASIAAFKQRQQQAFDEERARWAALGQTGRDVAPPVAEPAANAAEAPLPDGAVAVTSPVAGNLWKLLVAPGDRVGAGDPIAIVEAMKTEISVLADEPGTVRQVLLAPGDAVAAGARVVVLDAA